MERSKRVRRKREKYSPEPIVKRKPPAISRQQSSETEQLHPCDSAIAEKDSKVSKLSLNDENDHVEGSVPSKSGSASIAEEGIVTSSPSTPLSLSASASVKLGGDPSAPLLPSLNQWIEGLSPMNLGNGKVQCSLCSAKMKTTSFRQHLRCHIDIRLHECGICGQNFGRKGDVQNHIKVVHHGQRQYPCPLCEKGFGDKKNFNLHMAHHDRRKFYVCDVCGFRFGKREYWENHVKFIHPPEMLDQPPDVIADMLAKEREKVKASRRKENPSLVSESSVTEIVLEEENVPVHDGIKEIVESEGFTSWNSTSGDQEKGTHTSSNFVVAEDASHASAGGDPSSSFLLVENVPEDGISTQTNCIFLGNLESEVTERNLEDVDGSYVVVQDSTEVQEINENPNVSFPSNNFALIQGKGDEYYLVDLATAQEFLDASASQDEVVEASNEGNICLSYHLCDTGDMNQIEAVHEQIPESAADFNGDSLQLTQNSDVPTDSLPVEIVNQVCIGDNG